MPDLLAVTPSRGRPQNLSRLITAMAATCHADTDLAVGLDADDSELGNYLSLLGIMTDGLNGKTPGLAYQVKDGMHHRVVDWINLLATRNPGDYTAIAMLGDDCVPRTPGWDVLLLKALESTPLAFGADMEDEERPTGALCTHVFMRSEIVQRLGYFAPPVMRHLWIDLAWMTWGHAAGITYVPEAVIEHMHFSSNKAYRDEVYDSARALFERTDYRKLITYICTDLNSDLTKIDPQARHFTMDEFFQIHNQHGLMIGYTPGLYD